MFELVKKDFMSEKQQIEHARHRKAVSRNNAIACMQLHEPDSARKFAFGPTDLLPQRSTTFSAGYDIIAPYTFILMPFSKKRVCTFLRVKLEFENRFLMLCSTSSLVMRGIEVPNGSGIIDYDYYDTGKAFSVIVKNTTIFPKVIHFGEKIAQGIVMSYSALMNETRPCGIRRGGFGSTNKRR